MITHKTYKTVNDEWIMPREVYLNEGKLLEKRQMKLSLRVQVKKCLSQRKM